MAVEDVRERYRSRAAEYTELLGSVDDMAAQDRALISEWAATIDGPAIDAGCGPGHWTKFIADHGVAVEGVDMVPEFVEVATERFPDVTFRLGRLESLPVDVGGLGGVLAWYSVIHTDPADVPAILAEFARAIRPAGTLLLGFFEGPRLEPFDHAVVTAYFWPAPEMRSALDAAGFDVVETHTRTDPGHRPYGAILARRR
ncbi:class I SAM-dependent methyltransferase [Agromyces lapidis]|uniref:Class I SAM-dependent methyltransferase n=1 Tax=Agromyces lapidis TaxID=279574 RepID=A0ABV5SNR1_9MICO|nr:class I SAM-dependent methyltransferase [Agromyces lapidis]